MSLLVAFLRYLLVNVELVFAGLFAGILAFFLFPIVVGGIRPSWGDRLAQQYYQDGMSLLGRALLVKRKHGGYWLKASSFDAKHGKERTTIGGETKHFEDPENLMSRLFGFPFAIAHEESGTIIDARLAEIGEVARDWARKGQMTYENSDGETFVNGFIPIPDADRRLVNPDHALALVSGDANPGTTDWAIEITKQLLAPFKDANYLDWISGLIVLAGAWGLCWIAFEVLGTNGGSGASRTVGIGAGMIGVMI